MNTAPARSVRVATAIAATALVLGVAACAKDSTAGSPAPSPTPSVGATGSPVATTSTPVRRAALSPQGFLPKEMGQLA